MIELYHNDMSTWAQKVRMAEEGAGARLKAMVV